MFNQVKLYLYVLVKYVCILRVRLSSQPLQADEKLKCGNMILEIFKWVDSPQRILILAIQQLVYPFFHCALPVDLVCSAFLKRYERN